jgi:neutral ceramidase
MQAGFSKATINPPLGMPMEGLGQVGGCTSIHDDLFVRALYVSDQGQDVLIVSFDLLFFERAVIDRYKGSLGGLLGMKPEQILLNTTHTHAGPRMTRWAYSGAPEEEYLDQIQAALHAAALRAKASQKPVTLWAGSTKSSVPVSRRKLDDQGKAQWWPTRHGTICEAQPFAVLKDDAGGVVSVLTSIACHPSMIYKLEISADFPGVAVRKLNEHFKTEGAIFLQGAAGDTKPRQVADEKIGWRHGTWEQVEAAGTEVAQAVIDASAKSLKRVKPEIRTSLSYVDWPLNVPPSRAELESIKADANVRAERRLWATDMLNKLDRGQSLPSTVSLTVHFLQLGAGLRLVGVEGEVLAKLGLQMLGVFDKGVTFALGYTNGTQIYLPVTEELPEGGYEIDSYWEYHFPSACAPGCEKVLIDELRRVRDSGVIPNADVTAV